MCNLHKEGWSQQPCFAEIPLHKKWSFSLRISSFFVQCTWVWSFLDRMWILLIRFLFGVKQMIIIYAKNIKNLQKISFCLVWPRKQYKVKSVRALRKYYNQLNNLEFQSSKGLWFTKECIKNVKKSIIDVQDVKYYQLPISILTTSDLILSQLKKWLKRKSQ